MNDGILKQDSWIPRHKMGFKILNESQLKNMFPTYKNLFSKIDIHRTNISKIEMNVFQQDYQYNLMYDNLFSIFGKRGSGKTSAIFTLKKFIHEKYGKYGDYVLPIIMPEMIPDACDIMSWILAILDDIVTELDSKISSNSDCISDRDFFKNCKFKSDNKLRLEYKKIQELYFSKGYNVRQEESFETAIGNNGAQIQYSYKFSKSLVQFWTTLKECIKKVRNKDVTEEPLIYIIFDDMDLAPDKVVQMLSVIIKYLSHPNLIVIVTADEEQFNEVVENSLERKFLHCLNNDNDINRYYSKRRYNQYVYQNLIKKQSDLKTKADLYLGKVLPPSSRYYLNTFDTCDKKQKFIENVCEINSMEEDIDLEKFLCDCINDLKNEKNESHKNFLYYNDQFIKTYLLFWGNTSRQLANECILIKELISCLKRVDCFSRNEDGIVSEIYQQVYYFLYNTIITNVNINLTSEEITELINNIWCIQYDRYSLYIRYEYLNEYITYVADADMDQIELVIKLYVLLFFVENTLCVWHNVQRNGNLIKTREWHKIHGIKYLIQFLDQISTKNDEDDLSLIQYEKNSNNIEQIFYYYGWIMEEPEFLRSFDLSNYADTKIYIDRVGKKRNFNITKKHILDWSEKNPKWFKSMVKISYMAFNEMYMWSSRDISRLNGNFSNILQFDPYIIFSIYKVEKTTQEIIVHNDAILDKVINVDKEVLNGIKNLKCSNDSTFNEIYSEMDRYLSKNNIKNNTIKGAYFFKYFCMNIDDNKFNKDEGINDWICPNLSNLKTLISDLREKLYELESTYTEYRIIDRIRIEDSIERLKRGILSEEEFMEEKDTISKTQINNIQYEMETFYTPMSEEMLEERIKSVAEDWLAIKRNLVVNIEGNIERAKLFVALWESIIFVQRYYVSEYIKCEKKEKRTFERRNFDVEEKEKNFFAGFYKRIKELISKKEINDNRERYVATLIKEQIEYAGKEYFQNLKEY